MHKLSITKTVENFQEALDMMCSMPIVCDACPLFDSYCTPCLCSKYMKKLVTETDILKDIAHKNNIEIEKIDESKYKIKVSMTVNLFYDALVAICCKNDVCTNCPLNYSGLKGCLKYDYYTGKMAESELITYLEEHHPEITIEEVK